MITESFLNSCFTVILNKEGKEKRNRVIVRDVLSILDFYENKTEIDIPVTIKTKFDCLKTICDLLLNDRSEENIIDSIDTKKYLPIKDFIVSKMNEDVEYSFTTDTFEQIRIRKKLITLFTNYREFSNFLDEFNNGNFNSLDEIVGQYESLIKSSYSKIMTENRGIAIEATASLDLVQDSYDSVIESIKTKYERQCTIPTGFHVFDNEILNGGLEPSRLYVIGGSSGAGKSTLLTNWAVNAATKNIQYFEGQDDCKPKIEGIENVYLYISLENTIEESLMRVYQNLFEKRTNDILREIAAGGEEIIKSRIQEALAKTKSTIVMKYFPAKSISALDIMGVFDDLVEIYGEGTIKGGYIDYLDLLKTDNPYDMYRIELGDITLALKSLAVEYKIPIVVPTQLGRSSYRISQSHDLNLDQVSESIKKVEHADFVMLMSKDKFDQELIHARVGKNRSGKSEISIDFKVDFSMFKFISGNKVSNEGKPNVTTEKIIGFEGLGETF